MRSCFCGIIVIFVSMVTNSWAAVIALGPIVNVTGPSTNTTNIIWTHADPSDARHLIACTMFKGPSGNVASTLYISADDGKTWQHSLLDNSTNWVSEVNCTYGNNGRTYFVAGASVYRDGITHHTLGHLHVFASNDYGQTWTHTWTRSEGWIDWTYLADIPPSRNHPDTLVVFGNVGTDRLGHWWEPRPVAIVSKDGGRSFSRLIAPHPSGFHYVSAFTGGSVVLPNDTALFAATTAITPLTAKVDIGSWRPGRMNVEIFAYNPSKRTVRSLAVIHSIRNFPIFTAELARDDSNGRFGGRLYAAWVEATAKTSALWLAISDDGGHKWKVRPILTGRGHDFVVNCMNERPIDKVSLAVAPDGTLGMLWLANRTTVLFAVSHNGGTSFESPMTVADMNMSRMVFSMGATESYTMWLRLRLDTGHPFPGAEWQKWRKLPGLSISANFSVLDGDVPIALTTNRGNQFHAFWTAEQAVLTRTIEASGVVQDSKTFTARDVPAACARESAYALARPAIPAPLPMLAVSGHREVTQSIRFEPVRSRYDVAAHKAVADMIIINKGKTVLRSPLWLVALDPHSDFGIARAANAIGYIQGHPYWDVSSALPAKGLVPGAHSVPVHIVMTISRFQPPMSSYLEGDIFATAIGTYELHR